MLTSNTAQTNVSVNSSASFNNTSIHCAETITGSVISLSFTVTRSFLLVPLCSFVLYLGYQRWRQQRSFANTSHTDIITYNLATIELIATSGTIFYFCGIYMGRAEVMTLGDFVSSMVFSAEICFHILTCVERYLAVVHPLTYLGLKQSGGVKIRNISIACVWLLCFGWGSVSVLYSPNFPYIPASCSLVFSLIVVSFCSLRVLCVLIRPGPGEVGGDRERVAQSKQRAFHTVMAIMGVLCLWLVGFFVGLVLGNSDLQTTNVRCALLLSSIWFSLPSSLVLPLLFLHRAGKVLCCHERHE